MHSIARPHLLCSHYSTQNAQLRIYDIDSSVGNTTQMCTGFRVRNTIMRHTFPSEPDKKLKRASHGSNLNREARAGGLS